MKEVAWSQTITHISKVLISFSLWMWNWDVDLFQLKTVKFLKVWFWTWLIDWDIYDISVILPGNCAGKQHDPSIEFRKCFLNHVSREFISMTNDCESATVSSSLQNIFARNFFPVIKSRDCDRMSKRLARYAASFCCRKTDTCEK